MLVQEAEERVQIREEKEQAEKERAKAVPAEELLNEDEDMPECLPPSKKRALEQSASTPGYSTDNESPSCATAGPKRARLDEQTSILGDTVAISTFRPTAPFLGQRTQFLPFPDQNTLFPLAYIPWH